MPIPRIAFFILFVSLWCIPKRAYTQYPFEKFRAIEYKEYKKWTVTDSDLAGNISGYRIDVPNFFGNESLALRITIFPGKYGNFDSAVYRIYKGKKLVQKISGQSPPYPRDTPEPLLVADINGDSMPDLKLILPYHSCGLGLSVRVVYLFQNHNNQFTSISYDDMMGGNRAERDVDGDGNYEIITNNLEGYKGHSYWLFNIYNYRSNSLVNVGDKLGYPIMVQFLFRENYQPANIDKAVLKKFSLKLPERCAIKLPRS